MAAAEPEGIALAMLGKRVRGKFRTFKLRDLGYAQFRPYLDDLDGIEVEQRDGQSYARLADKRELPAGCGADRGPALQGAARLRLVACARGVERPLGRGAHKSRTCFCPMPGIRGMDERGGASRLVTVGQQPFVEVVRRRFRVLLP